MNLLKNKKHTETKKETTPLKMKRGQKKLFALYAVMVLTFCIGATCVYAAGDPLAVVNNLSTFIFSLIRAIGLILLGFGIVQVGLSLKSHDPSQRANGFLTLAGGIIITLSQNVRHTGHCTRDPGSDHGLGSETRRGAMRNAGSPLTFAGWEVKLFE